LNAISGYNAEGATALVTIVIKSSDLNHRQHHPMLQCSCGVSGGINPLDAPLEKEHGIADDIGALERNLG
jgi:hypothetical protein